MGDRYSLRQILREPPQLSLRVILIGQLLILMGGMSGLTAWLTWQSEQQMTTNLVSQLQSEISDRIKQKLTSYLETPHLVNRINVDAIQQGNLKPEGIPSEKYLWRQILQFPNLAWIYYGEEKTGKFIGISRQYILNNQKGEEFLEIAINNRFFQRFLYPVNANGDRLAQSNVASGDDKVLYDPRQRPWFQSAIKANGAVWSSIYQDFKIPQQIITASLVVKDISGKRIGVLGADLTLGNINNFLSSLQIGKSGEALIVEPSGLLVASSILEDPQNNSSPVSSAPKRILIRDSQQPLIKATALYLEQKFPSLSQITTQQDIKFAINGKNIFLKVLPYQDDRGLDWKIIVIMPEADFTEAFELNRQKTLLFSFLILVGAIAIGVVTTQQINRALKRLTLASQSIAHGNLQKKVPPVKIKELNVLSETFNIMAAQLKQSFGELEVANEYLESRIQERTKDLQTSEVQFRSLVNNFTGIVYRYIYDQDWTIIFIGGAVAEITGYSAEEFIREKERTWSSIIHPEDRDRFELAIQECLDCGQPFVVEYRIIDIRGNTHWLYERGQGIFDENQRLLYLDGAIFDISDRKKVETELLERVHLSILMAEIGYASTQLDGLQDVLQSYAESLWRHMNISFTQIWAVNPTGDSSDIQAHAGNYNQTDSARLCKLISQEIIDAIFNGKFQPLLTDQLMEDLAEADQEWLNSLGITSLVGYPLMIKNRVIGIVLLISTSHLKYDVKELESIANEIAIGINHKQSEDKIKATNAEMKALFESIDEVILVRDRLGRIIKIPHTRRNLGWMTPEQVIGKLPQEIFPLDKANLITSNVQRVLETKQTINFEYSFSLEENSTWWSANISPIDDETVVWVARDISDRKLFEQQLKQSKQIAEAASQAKGHFLASMSHELRTPLNAILGFTQLIIRDSTLKDNHRSYLKIIHESGEHLLELINDVLDMSKIESGRISLNITSFDLYHLLETLEKMFRLRASEKKLDLIFRRSPSIPQWISTDEGKLRQILINLLSNAIKFTAIGSVTLSIELATENTLRFIVKDTGVGIPKDYLDKIFEPFEQTEIGKRATEGTGLGLSISRKFAQIMGGEIAVSSKVGEGSQFVVDLPVKISESVVSSQFLADRYVIGLAPSQPQYRILVVEDRWESRHLLVKILEEVGFQVREAENGAEAIAIWEEWEPHLIWMDMRMPVMDGYEATRQIKSHLKGQATVIIALTASALEEERTIILSAGCDDFVRKPFREALIFNKLAEYLGVTYTYEEEGSDPSRINRSDDMEVVEVVLTKQLKQSPKGWIKQLQQAAMLADNDLITELLKEVPSSNPLLIQSLISLVDNFCYNQIMAATAKALEQMSES
ncbi:MAG: hypothetical protein DCE90_02335 [Pseudanabaena sp.]|nr:MAG: hypothetical protein DCE90_02335 [Pseudanabaena sp.]